MKLRSHHINQIKEFLKAYNIDYVEVQMEIIDHIASKVEDELKRNPHADLDQLVLYNCGQIEEMGFDRMENSMKKSFNKRMMREFWKIYRSYVIGANVPVTLVIIAMLLTSRYIFKTDNTAYSVGEFASTVAISSTIVLTIIHFRIFKGWYYESLMLKRCTIPFAFMSYLYWYISVFVLKDMLSPASAWFWPIFLIVTLIFLVSAFVSVGLARWGYKWSHENYFKYVPFQI